MATLLGFVDGVIANDGNDSTKLINKVGGSAKWLTRDIQTPVCDLCGSTCFLVVQLYCPLDNSNYHRCLYVFTCGKRSCWNNAASWKVFRQQTLDDSFDKNTCSQHSHMKSTLGSHTEEPGKENWATEQDDWGVDTDDWSMDGDDWGSEALKQDVGVPCAGTDDYRENTSFGKCDDHLEHKNTHTCNSNASSDMNATSENVEVNLMERVEVESNEIVNKHLDEDRECVISEAGSTLIHDNENKGDILEQKMESDIVDQMSELYLNAMEKSQNSEVCGKHKDLNTSLAEQPIVPQSYYISVIEECDLEVSKGIDKHVEKLIKEYSKLENVFYIGTDKAEGGSGGEMYEKTDARHKDKTFYKFSKKISVFPQQCIRYELGGKPLFISDPKKTRTVIPMTCNHCSKPLVFEFQLLPTLINFLQLPNQKEPLCEYGTVMVFSCEQSCWTAEDHYRIEQVVLQADPDSHLYNKP